MSGVEIIQGLTTWHLSRILEVEVKASFSHKHTPVPATRHMPFGACDFHRVSRAAVAE